MSSLDEDGRVMPRRVLKPIEPPPKGTVFTYESPKSRQGIMTELDQKDLDTWWANVAGN